MAAVPCVCLQLCKDKGKELSVCVIEKGAEVGACSAARARACDALLQSDRLRVGMDDLRMQQPVLQTL